MSRPRLALAGGGVLAAAACVLGCFVPALLETQPPWRDPVAEQAAWGHTLGWLLATSAILATGAWILLASGFVGWRTQRRRAARGMAAQDEQPTKQPSRRTMADNHGPSQQLDED
jgi:hypothetical protein